MHGSRQVLEELSTGEIPLWHNPEWAERFPWLVQGITGAGAEAEPFDLGLFGDQPVGAALERWRRVIAASGMSAAVHARQVHGGAIRVHEGEGWTGLLVMDGVDGHLTREPDLLLTVSVADCVPVAVVDAERRCIALVHAGWRGVVAGIAERAVEMMLDSGSSPDDLFAHTGPSICGSCYEVGPEVHAGVNPHLVPPAQPEPVDLRTSLSRRLLGAGLRPESVTRSGHCTRCGQGMFFSHRGGSPARQMSVLGRQK